MSMSQKRILIAVAVVAVGFGWYLFRPELLFVDSKVNEAFPEASAEKGSAGMLIGSGEFRSGAHETKGEARIHRLPDGRRILRLTNFATSNGPDLRVILVAADGVKDSEDVKKAGWVEVARLKGNIGDQNYEIPADADLEKHRAVTIWCNRFGVNFGTAPLAAGSM
jgi:hypothetical protein